jgi:hypothetical protein
VLFESDAGVAHAAQARTNTAATAWQSERLRNIARIPLVDDFHLLAQYSGRRKLAASSLLALSDSDLAQGEPR